MLTTMFCCVNPNWIQCGFLDQTLSMRQHNDSVCRASFLELQRAATIRPYLPQRATARLSRQWSFLVLIIVTQSSQVYQQTTRHGLLWKKKKKKKRDQFTPLLKGLNWLPVKFHCQYKIATLAYRHFEESLPPYLYLSAPINHPGLSDLPKKSDSKSPSETWNLLGNVLLVSWRRLFGTHYQPISEICQHYLSSNLTSEPSCSPRPSRRSSKPDSRLCICICFVCF